MKNIKIVSIYVSHHSEEYVNKFGLMHKEQLGDCVYVVNSSSSASKIDDSLGFEIIDINDNIGFSAANNIAIRAALKYNPDYILIINPDVLLPSLWLTTVLKEIAVMQEAELGVISVPLLGYDFEKSKPNGLIDSLGIEHTWYGRWFDVSQGDDARVLDTSKSPYETCAACGALMLVHKDAIYELLERDGSVFNESYFMYKEDVELSIRVRRLGRKIIMIPSAPAYHCRGWASRRADSPYWAREMSARNELKMHLKFYWRYLPYSFIKYMYVRTIERLRY